MRVRWVGESCSGATTRARRRGGVCVSELGGSSPSMTRPELVWAGAVRRAACAEPICGGNSPSARRLRREAHAGPSHGGSDDGGAPGGCAGCGSCSGATTKARRRGGRLRQRTWGELAVHDQAGACAGGSSSASSLRGADLRGELAVHRGGRGGGGARGRVRWAGESCSGATTRARRRGGRLRQ